MSKEEKKYKDREDWLLHEPLKPVVVGKAEITEDDLKWVEEMHRKILDKEKLREK